MTISFLASQIEFLESALAWASAFQGCSNHFESLKRYFVGTDWKRNLLTDGLVREVFLLFGGK